MANPQCIRCSAAKENPANWYCNACRADTLAERHTLQARARENAKARQRRVESNHDSRVYFIEAKGVDRVKIGWTKNLSLRMKDFITSCPVDIEELFTLPGGAAEELALHTRFRAHRVRGEWFVLSAIREELNALALSTEPIAPFCATCTVCGEPKRAGRRQDKVIDRPCRRCSRDNRRKRSTVQKQTLCAACHVQPIGCTTAQQRPKDQPLLCRGCAMKEAWKDPEYRRLRAESRAKNRAARIARGEAITYNKAVKTV